VAKTGAGSKFGHVFFNLLLPYVVRLFFDLGLYWICKKREILFKIYVVYFLNV